MWRKWAIVIVGLLAAQLLWFTGVRRVEERRLSARSPVTPESREQPAVDIVVEGSDGSTQTIRARSERFQLVHFWATWCPPCREELPELLRLAGRLRGRIDVWAVSADRDWASIRGFLAHPVPATIVRDPTGEAARLYEVRELPDTYLVGPDGRIRARFAQAQDWGSREMRGFLEGVLAEP